MFAALWVGHLKPLARAQGADLPQSAFAIGRDYGFNLTSQSDEINFGLRHACSKSSVDHCATRVSLRTLLTERTPWSEMIRCRFFFLVARAGRLARSRDWVPHGPWTNGADVLYQLSSVHLVLSLVEQCSTLRGAPGTLSRFNFQSTRRSPDACMQLERKTPAPHPRWPSAISLTLGTGGRTRWSTKKLSMYFSMKW